MKLTVNRDNSTIEETLGTLVIDGTFFGYTLELPKGTTKMAGIASGILICIPAGEYKVKVTFSEHMQKRLPLIYNDDATLAVITPEGRWDGVRFHGGNTYLDSLACILVGRNRYLNKPSGFFNKTHHVIMNWIQGSLGKVLAAKLDDGQIHSLTIK